MGLYRGIAARQGQVFRYGLGMAELQDSTHQPPPSLAQYRRQRAATDLYQRALPGTIFYGIALAITAWVGGYFAQYSGYMALAFVLYGALWYLRWVHTPPQDDQDTQAAERWWWRHWALVDAGCLVWCLFFLAVGYLEQGPSTAFLVAAVSTIAFSSAGCETYSLHKRQALWVVVLLQVPALLYFALAVPALWPVCAVLAVYFAYQLTHIRRRAAEYDTQMALEHALITSRSEVERLSRLDALTGLANRREYDSTFRAHWRLAARQQGRLALMVVDLDHFKRINDTYGHLAGDACLRQVARLMGERFKRSSDMVARIGGEEFAVLLPDTSAEEAMQLAQTLCHTLAGSPVPWDEHHIPVTASIGVDCMRWDLDLTPQASFSRIDSACYTAKAKGRNRVVQA
jgi:diguanylate cyclase (GGDEF)-like protein